MRHLAARAICRRRLCGGGIEGSGFTVRRKGRARPSTLLHRNWRAPRRRLTAARATLGCRRSVKRFPSPCNFALPNGRFPSDTIRRSVCPKTRTGSFCRRIRSCCSRVLPIRKARGTGVSCWPPATGVSRIRCVSVRRSATSCRNAVCVHRTISAIHHASRIFADVGCAQDPDENAR